MKIGSQEWKENRENVQTHSYEPKDNGQYETANRQEIEKSINL